MTGRRDRLLSIGAAVLVFGLALLVVFSLLDAQRRGRDALEDLQVEQVNQLARSLDARLVTTLAQVAGIFAAPPAWNLKINDPADKDRIDKLQALNPAARTGYLLVDRGGVITNGTLLRQPAVGTHLDRIGLDSALTSTKPVILPIAPGLTTPLPTVALVFGLTDGSGTITGAVVLEAEVAADSAFNAEVAQLRRGRTDEFSFVDSQGLVVASNHTDNLARPLGGSPDLTKVAPGFVRSGSTVAAVADVPSAGWRAVFRQDASEFEGGLGGRVRTALFLLLLAAVIGSGLVFIVLLRRLKAAREEERRLTEINAARDEFVSIVSHELRTPVAGVLGFLETTIDHWDSMDEGERKGAVLRAVSNARRLQALARDVLDMERIDAADMPFAPEIVDVVAKVREAVSDLSGAEPDRPITVSLPEGPVYAAVDEGQFFQVMANLVDNAFKNSPVTEPVEVSVAADDGAVVVTVTDHGPGIPDIDRQRVFDKFARGRSTTRGTGLGLYICRQIVERHGGTISADGVEGEGAAISFRIPLAPQPVAAP